MLKITKTILMSCIIAISLLGCSSQSHWVETPKLNKENVQAIAEPSYEANISVYSLNPSTKDQTLIYSQKYESFSDGNNQQLISYGKNPFIINNEKFIFLNKDSSDTFLYGKILIIRNENKINVGTSTNISYSHDSFTAECATRKNMSLSIPSIRTLITMREVTSFPHEEKLVVDNYIAVVTVTKK